jgi:peptidyl-prolyl cis-trans isomerase C
MQLRASHILVTTKESADDLLRQINEGADFAVLARQNSSCPSGQNGGDLGTFGPGMMVKPFEDATIATSIGSVSQPVQTQFGWHLVKRTA